MSSVSTVLSKDVPRRAKDTSFSRFSQKSLMIATRRFHSSMSILWSLARAARSRRLRAAARPVLLFFAPDNLEPVAADEITRAAREGGMTSLREDGWLKVRQGRTSIEEVLRVVG